MSKPGLGSGYAILVKAYLIVFNTVLTFGWSYLLYLTGKECMNSKSAIGSSAANQQLWKSVEHSLKIFQTAAILEVANAALRFVPSNVFLTFFQVLSRVFVLWGVLNISPLSQQSVGVPLLLFAWCVTEIIRYGYYVLHLIGYSKLIEWFRYTFFIVLYPIGVTGELLCLYNALWFVWEKDMWSFHLPNAFNTTFDYGVFLVGAMLMYIPIFPQLYCHMFAQRKKVLGGGSRQKKE